ncbi:hypothetical protein CALCODRAFT_336657 [Calocera cornea HHB12733]|uniref:Uncharacterized protein n=1 Tax=Calocera cornea HHB12733 TaxID=1353952 RepID=A0A165F0S8_9BASI|nr:hypothetical protein CALCODRAFT_336657 [Calocera cornea HHB12733]
MAVGAGDAGRRVGQLGVQATATGSFWGDGDEGVVISRRREGGSRRAEGGGGRDGGWRIYDLIKGKVMMPPGFVWAQGGSRGKKKQVRGRGDGGGVEHSLARRVYSHPATRPSLRCHLGRLTDGGSPPPILQGQPGILALAQQTQASRALSHHPHRLPP